MLPKTYLIESNKLEIFGEQMWSHVAEEQLVLLGVHHMVQQERR